MHIYGFSLSLLLSDELPFLLSPTASSLLCQISSPFICLLRPSVWLFLYNPTHRIYSRTLNAYTWGTCKPCTPVGWFVRVHGTQSRTMPRPLSNRQLFCKDLYDDKKRCFFIPRAVEELLELVIQDGQLVAPLESIEVHRYPKPNTLTDKLRSSQPWQITP